MQQPDPAVSTITSTSLLEGLKSPDNHSVWREFTDRYRPMIVGYARKSFGFSAADADDAAQEALNAFFQAYQKGAYDREKGRLRDWLFGIATRQIKNYMRQAARRREVLPPDTGTGTAFMARVPDESQLEKIWHQQWQRAIFKQCLDEARQQLDPKTMKAYAEYVEQGVPVEQVARQLDMTINAVYLAKHHVLARIRELIPRMQDTW